MTELADEIGAALEERDGFLRRALTLAGRLHELQTDLALAAADVDDDELSAATAAIRVSVIHAGNRLAALRRQPV